MDLVREHFPEPTHLIPPAGRADSHLRSGILLLSYVP